MKNKQIKSDIATALRLVRVSKGLTQEDFSLVSSRTYMSSLERGIKSPTLGKLEAIAVKLGVHPMTLLAIAYCKDQTQDSIADLLAIVQADLASLEIASKEHLR